MTPFSMPLAAAILGGISFGNTAVADMLIEGFTSKRKKYFKQKCDHVNDYLNKMEILFIKCKFLPMSLSCFESCSRTLLIVKGC